MKLETEIEKMYTLLAKYPSYRSGKYSPMAHRLWEELPAHLQTPQVREVLKLITEPKKLPAMETLSRAWRKVMEMNKHWITAEHARRRAEGEHDVKTVINSYQ